MATFDLHLPFELAGDQPDAVNELSTGLSTGQELFVGATKSAPAQAFFKTTGIEPWTTTAAELARFQAAESAKWARVIKAAGIQPE